MVAPLLQVIDNFLLNYNIGDVLLLVVVVGAVVLFLRRTQQLLGLHLLTFGLLFVVLPAGMFGQADSSLFPDPVFYKFVGLALLVVSPILIVLARR